MYPFHYVTQLNGTLRIFKSTGTSHCVDWQIFTRTSKALWQSTESNITEDLNPHQHRWRNLKSRNGEFPLTLSKAHQRRTVQWISTKGGSVQEDPINYYSNYIAPADNPEATRNMSCPQTALGVWMSAWFNNNTARVKGWAIRCFCLSSWDRMRLTRVRIGWMSSYRPVRQAVVLCTYRARVLVTPSQRQKMRDKVEIWWGRGKLDVTAVQTINFASNKTQSVWCCKLSINTINFASNKTECLVLSIVNQYDKFCE
jgi:hypothetical protein